MAPIQSTLDKILRSDMVRVVKGDATPATAKPSPGRVVKRTSQPAFKPSNAAAYAPPSKYSHLKELVDIMEPGLTGIFVGFNPGIATATAGHAYAHPTNQFWRILAASGLTDRLYRPQDDVHLPKICSMGNTNIVSRPSKDVAELGKSEIPAGTPALEEKVLHYKPESVCVVGKAIWEGIWQHQWGRKPRKAEFHYGWQDARHNLGRGARGETGPDGEAWKGARVFVATSTSGLSANLSLDEKVEIWRPYADFVTQRKLDKSTSESADEHSNTLVKEGSSSEQVEVNA